MQVAAPVIVDAHLHLLPTLRDGYSGWQNMRPVGLGKLAFETGSGANRSLRWFPPLMEDCTFKVETAIEYMDWLGIDKAVVVQCSGYGIFDDYCVECLHRYPDRFVIHCTLNPAHGPEAVDYLERCVRGRGFSGVNLHPGAEFKTGGYFLNNPAVMPFWEKAAELEIPVTVHLSLPGLNRYAHQVAQLAEVAERFPDLPIILDHLGVPSFEEQEPYPLHQETCSLAQFPSVYITISALPFHSHCEFPYPDAGPLIRMAYEAFGAPRLMWASDAPSVLRICTYHQTLAYVRALQFLSEWDKRWIFGHTALNVMRFPGADTQDGSSLLFKHIR